MTEEFLDIFDENNEPTGESMPRSKVHAEGLWHRTVHSYVFRKNKGGVEFLVHLRSKFKDLHPNHWDTRVGGHIKSGVSLEDSAVGEIKEEIGLDVEAKDLIKGGFYKGGKFPNQEFVQIFFLEYDGRVEDLKFNDGEVQEARWMKLEDIKNSIANGPEKWTGSLSRFAEVSDYLINKI